MLKKLLLVGVFIYILIMISFQLTPYIQKQFNIELAEPELGTYTSDEVAFLKTFYLMEKGNDYYLAYKIARENYASGNLIQSKVSTWRSPVVFYLWNIFSENGEDILTIFVFFMFISLICSYLLLKKFMSHKLSLIGSLAIAPYFYDSLKYKTAFLFTEWWGLFFFLIGLVAIVYKRYFVACLGLILAILSRELFIIPVLGFLLLRVIQKKEIKYFLVPIIVFFLFYFFHWHNVTNIMMSTNKVNITVDRFHFYSILNLHKMLSFSMRQYVLFGLKTHYLVLLLGFMSLILNIILSRKYELLYLFVAVISFLILLPAISVKENDYWGITFVPLLLISLPLLMSFNKNDVKNSP